MTGEVHKHLVGKASAWLAKQRATVVITDMVSGAGEQPDAIGWTPRGSILVECKASRADFHADKAKHHRGPFGMGHRRYFLAPAGMLQAAELPHGWGLLELDAKDRVREIRPAEPRNTEYRLETYLLLSCLRRIGQHPPEGVSVRCYTIQTKRTATVGLLPLPEAG